MNELENELSDAYAKIAALQAQGAAFKATAMKRAKEVDAARKRVETLMYHLDHWESQQHATVGIAFIRNHFEKAS